MPNDNKKSTEFAFEKKEDESGNIKYISNNYLEKNLELTGDKQFILRRGIGNDVTLAVNASKVLIKGPLGENLVIDMDKGANVTIESEKTDYGKNITFIHRDKRSKLAYSNRENSEKEKLEKFCKTTFDRLENISETGYTMGKIPENTCLYLDDGSDLPADDKKTILAKGTGESVTIEKRDSEELIINGKEIGKDNHFICKTGAVTIGAKAIGDDLYVELDGNVIVFVDTKKESIGQNVKFKCNSENSKVEFTDVSITSEAIERYVIPYKPAQESFRPQASTQ